MAKTGAGTPYPYLNSGLVVGYAGAIQEMLGLMLEWDTESLREEFCKEKGFRGYFNDQTLAGVYAVDHPDEVAIDHNARLFWNFSGECSCLDSVLEWNGMCPINVKTGSKPAVLHVPYIRKYYPALLLIANNLGMDLCAGNVDLRLFDAHLTGTVDNIDEHVLTVAGSVRTALTRLWAYRLMKLKDQVRWRAKRTRITLGRFRQAIHASFRNLRSPR